MSGPSPADVFHRELTARGLDVLHVSQSEKLSEVFRIYLHGNAGQWAAGHARLVIATMPDVIKVIQSVQTPTILLARLRSTT